VLTVSLTSIPSTFLNVAMTNWSFGLACLSLIMAFVWVVS